MKTKHEVMFYILVALALFIGNARAGDARPPVPCAHLCVHHGPQGTDSLTLHTGPHAVTWTGDLLTLRWGTHQIEFDAVTMDNWSDDSGIFFGNLDDVYEHWTIDVRYNNYTRHIPMMCHVVLYQTPGIYDVEARCYG